MKTKKFKSGLLVFMDDECIRIFLQSNTFFTSKLNYNYLRKRVKHIFKEANTELPYAEDIEECALFNVTITDGEIIDVDPRMIFPMREEPKYFDFTGGEQMDGTDDICKNRYNNKV